MNVLSESTSGETYRALAQTRIREARVLLRAQEFDGAYYLAGYAVECAIKAIVVSSIPAGVLLSPKAAQQLYTHDIKKLADHAELHSKLKTEASERQRVSWTTIIAWSEQRRYQIGVDEVSATSFLDAVDNPAHGVLPWLMQSW